MSFWKRNRAVFKAIVVVAVFLGVVVFSGMGYIWSKLDKVAYADDIASDPIETSGFSESGDYPSEETYSVVFDPSFMMDTAPTIPDTAVVDDSDVMNILLIGTDERSTVYSDKARADSMILVSINRKLHTVRLVSLERGIGVPILEGKYAGEYDLLTHIFRWGGADLLIKTVEHCFKIDVKHYVRLNFAAVEKIVDTIGGIDLEISEDEAFGLNEWAGDHNRIVHPGVNRVNGETALRFARLRWIDSDWQRVGRQRKVILSVVNELKDSSLKELDNLADEVLPLIQTNLKKLEIAELILYAPNFFRSEFDQMTIPKQGTYGGMAIRKGAGAFAVDYEINNDLLYRFLYEGATSEELLAE